jgi:hypothetical protein
MGSFFARFLGIVAASTLSVTIFGGGVAYADMLVGKTYDEASGVISGWEGDAVIGTVSGAELETGDCVVTSWQKSRFLDTSGKNDRQNEFILHLNCHNRLSSPGQPGNSLQSPEGAAAKKDIQAANNINKNPDFCRESDEIAQWCEKVCNRTGLCEV